MATSFTLIKNMPHIHGTAYAYNIAFVNQDTNYAAALSFLLGFVIAVLSYIFQLSANRKERRSRG